MSDEQRKVIEDLNPKWQYFMTEDGRYLVYPNTVVELLTRQRHHLLEQMLAAIGEDEPEQAPARLTNTGKNMLRAELRQQVKAIFNSKEDK